MPRNTNRVDRLDDKLYSRTRYRDPLEKRSDIKEVEDAVPVEEKWQSPELDELLSHERETHEVTPFMKKVFTFSLFFFIATIAIAAFVFFGGINFVSSKNVDIEVVGPTSIAAGEVLDLGITIKNKNNTDLEVANFSINYPQGSREVEDNGKTLTYAKENLGVIGAGDEVVKSIPLVLLGTSGETKEFKFSIEYKVKGSNATFYKDKVYNVTIGNSPITLTVDTPKQVQSGEGFTTTVSIGLNATEVLRNVMLRGEYPYGFGVDNTSPSALADNNVWTLGDLSPGAVKKITIRGRLVGEDQDERTFRFYAGVADNDSVSPTFKTVVVSEQQTVAIEKPSFGMSVVFNNENVPTYIAPAEQPITTSVRFQNNLEQKILNPRLEVRINGNAVNKAAIASQNGGTVAGNRVTWDLTNISGQHELAPGENNTVAFAFASLPQNMIGLNSEIGLEFILSGTPVSGENDIVVSEKRTVKIASQVTLASQVTHTVGAFTNTGPIPPKVGQETSYAIAWSLRNTQSDISNAKVTAKLGPGVKWVRASSIASEEIGYDQKTNTITWNLETLSTGSGFSAPTREVSFQVILTPTAAQVGSSPTLVNSMIFTGYNSTTGSTVNLSSPSLTTKMPQDPAFIQGDDIVVK